MSKKLYRSKKEKMIAGVGGGIADYFKIDPTIVRVLLVLIGLSMTEIFIIAYIVAAIIIPERPEGLVDEEDDVDVVDENGERVSKSHNNRQLLGILFVGAGALMLLSKMVAWFDSSMMLAIAIIAIGAYVLVKKEA